VRRDVEGKAHERYDTERKGSWLNTSLSKNLFNRSHDIGYGATARSAAGRFREARGIRDGRREGTIVQRHHASWNLDMNLRMGAEVSHGGTEGGLAVCRLSSWFK
jgi:hypothetical protein